MTKRYSLQTYLLYLLISLCCSCVDHDITNPNLPSPIEDENNVMLLSPPEFDIVVTRAQQEEIIQDSVTAQGVLVKIAKRPWVGMDLNSENDIKTRSTWEDVVWEENYADIGVFTVESDNVYDYLNSAKSIEDAEQYIKCFPFRRVMGDGTLDEEGKYYQPVGNAHAHNPYNYRNANIKINARDERKSTSFFEKSEGKELNFYGYYPYQHQTVGINYTFPATSICRILQANFHVDNLLAMPYTFAATQTKDNIRQHDLMYSVSEDAIDADISTDSRLDRASDRNKFGNRYKKRHDNDLTKNDNVHMRFEHAFCQLRINISPGNYRSGQTEPIKLSKLYLVGEKVFVDGNLNLIEGEVSPGTAATIYRALDNGSQKTDGDEIYVDLREPNLSIPMIVQPTRGPITSIRDFKIVCVVDGVEYTCSLATGVELEKNHIYDVNLVLDPETKILVSSGGGSNISGYLGDAFNDGIATKPASYIINGGVENEPFTSAKWMVVNPYNGWRIFKILKNGKPVDQAIIEDFTGPGANPGAKYMPITYTEGEVRNYTVVCIPEDWYALPEYLTVHLDGKLNTGFRREDVSGFKNELTTLWKDISYNGNDGVLYNFETAASAYTMPDGDVDILLGERSGWDGKGLRCDGKDDRVGFPGKINPTAYTISIYACIERDQPANSYPRIVSSGNNLADGFPGLTLDINTSTGRLRAYGGHNLDVVWGNGTNDAPYHGNTGRKTGVDIVQMDYTYSGNTITLYINGEYAIHRTVTRPAVAVDWSALGGRLSDISRQCHITYYNVMVYEKALNINEIKHNYAVNIRRYGEKKEETEPKTLISSGGGSTIKLYKEGEFNGSTGTQILSPSHTITGVKNEVLFKSIEWMTVEPESAGWEIFKILKDGVPMNFGTDPDTEIVSSGSTVYLNVKDLAGSKRYYDVICIPTTNWYAAPDMINMHLDGRLNQGFNEHHKTAENQLVTTWKDISYNGNDGTLLNIPFAETVRVTDKGANIALATPTFDGTSGWDGKGLKFDGWDDMVRFPGKINSSAYTISIYLCLEQNQLSTHPVNSSTIQYNWIVGTGTNNANGFPGIVFGRNATPWRLRNNGHGLDADYSPRITIPGTLGEDIIQIDYTFNLENKIDVYVNGEWKGNITNLTNTANPQPTVVLGNRTSDMIRAAHMTVYNMMIYNKSLSPAEIQHNYSINKARYGEKKAD